MARHNTLQEAMRALAEQYGVSTEWIESNMGNTNDLDTIHRNIRKSLQ
jgi:glucan phosphoethanolaminetransferase (alkaline phosphatase superfamily)